MAGGLTVVGAAVVLVLVAVPFVDGGAVVDFEVPCANVVPALGMG